MTDIPSSWADAQALRAAGWPDDLPKHFFTGKPCKRGHIAPRMASDGNCTECKRVQDRADQKRPHRAKRINAYAREYTKRSERRAAERSFAAAGRAALLQATPPWLTPAQKQAIRAVYEEADRLTRETGVPHEVDHIVPLRGKVVCGLHVPWNLQVLTARRNRSKSSHFTVDALQKRCKTP